MLRFIRNGPLARAISNNSSAGIASCFARAFSASAPVAAKPLPPRPKLNEDEIEVSYIKGSGPGGQKINKTNSAVQMIHKPTGVVVKCQATRSRSQNHKIAMEILAEKVEALEKGDQSRLAIKAERARKKKASRMKKSRRKYRALEEEKRRKEEEERALLQQQQQLQQQAQGPTASASADVISGQEQQSSSAGAGAGADAEPVVQEEVQEQEQEQGVEVSEVRSDKEDAATGAAS
ncbi:RF-1 domain-containing protein [Thermoascus aurantiacus ATCC 26904]